MPCCFVPFCDTGQGNQRQKMLRETKQMPIMFAVPKCPKRRKLWELNIRRRDDGKNKSSTKLKELQDKDKVCSRHFEERYIIRPVPNVHCAHIKRRIILTKDAVPTIFPGYPEKMQTKKKFTRMSPEERRLKKAAEAAKNSAETEMKDDISGEYVTLVSYTDSKTGDELILPDTTLENETCYMYDSDNDEPYDNYEITDQEPVQSEDEPVENEPEPVQNEPEPAQNEPEPIRHEPLTRKEIFQRIFEQKDYIEANKPSCFWAIIAAQHTYYEKFINCFRSTGLNGWVDIGLTLTETCEPVLRANGYIVPKETCNLGVVTDVKSLLNVLNIINKFNLCEGTGSRLYYENCLFLVEGGKKVCEPCAKKKHSIRVSACRLRKRLRNELNSKKCDQETTSENHVEKKKSVAPSKQKQSLLLVNRKTSNSENEKKILENHSDDTTSESENEDKN